jgi:hypothetical protein
LPDGEVNLPVQSRRTVEEIWFGALLRNGARGWVLGQDKEKKRWLDRQSYLIQYILYWFLGLRTTVTPNNFLPSFSWPTSGQHGCFPDTYA